MESQIRNSITSGIAWNGIFGAIAVAGAILFLLLGQFLIGPPNIHSARALTLVLEAGVIVYWLLSNPEAYFFRASRVFKWASVAWLSVGFITIPFASFSGAAAFIGHMEWVSHFLTLVALGDFYRRNLISLNHMLAGLILAALGILAYYCYRWILIENPRAYDWVWRAQPFLNIRHFAFLMLPAYVASFFFLVEKRGSWRFLLLLVSSVLLAALIWAGGRASMGSAAIGTGLLLLFGWRRGTIKVSTGVFLALIVVFGALLLSSAFSVDNPRMGLSFNHGRGVGDSADQMSGGRIGLWLSVFSDMSISEWLFGHGADNYRFLPGRLDATVHPHSLFFQVFSAWGFPVAVAIAVGLLWVLGWLVIRVIGTNKGELNEPLQADLFAAIAILLSYLALSMVDGNFYHSWAVLIILPVLALVLIAYLNSTNIDQVDQGVSLSSGWLYVSGALLVLVFVQLINVSTVFGSKVPQPNDWRAALVMAIPYNTIMVERWLGPWERQDQQQMLRLLTWLQDNSALGFRYMLMESEMLARAGYKEASMEKYEQALASAPQEARVKIQEAGPPAGPD